MIGNFNLGRRKCYRQYQLNVKFMSNLQMGRTNIKKPVTTENSMATAYNFSKNY
jgi:hypothetical protein